jgi:hypothetical protein
MCQSQRSRLSARGCGNCPNMTGILLLTWSPETRQSGGPAGSVVSACGAGSADVAGRPAGAGPVPGCSGSVPDGMVLYAEEADPDR